MTEEKKSSYSRIMKSSSLIGGAQAINMLIGMVRVKCVAYLIGPVGVGLVGTYRATVGMIGTIAGLGLQSSAVRDIADAVGSHDDERIGRTVLTLRRMCWLSGALGSLIVVLFSVQLSLLTFNAENYSLEISLVGLIVLFANIKGGQMALIQGMRRIADLAKMNIIGVAVGSLVSIAFYAWLGREGIVPAIVSLGVIELVISWWFARKITVPKVIMSWRESFSAAGGMIKLGLALMWNGLLLGVVGYLTRMMITRQIDLESVGIFTAGYGLSGMIVGFVLGAMGADYYPSLTAVSSDHVKMRDLVNEQTEIGLLLALPLLLGMMAFSPWAIRIFYTNEFLQAADLLKWFTLGCVGQVIAWPMGYVILAKGSARLYAATETLANIMHIVIIWALLAAVGIVGVAIAGAVLYVLYIVLMLFVCKKLIGFSWSASVKRLLIAMLSIFIGAFIAGQLLSEIPATLVGLLVTAGLSIYCLRELTRRLGPNHKISRFVAKLPFLSFNNDDLSR